MIPGGSNTGRIGTLVSRECYPGSFEIYLAWGHYAIGKEFPEPSSSRRLQRMPAAQPLSIVRWSLNQNYRGWVVWPGYGKLKSRFCLLLSGEGTWHSCGFRA